MNFQANSKSALLTQLDILIEQYRTVIQTTPSDKIILQPNGKWSIAQNIDHINKSNWLTTVGYKTPHVLLKIIFGKPTVSSRPTEDIIHTYQSKLKSGAKSPKLLEAGKSKPVDKNALLTHFDNQIASLKKSIATWSETDLEAYLLPHPILGKLTGKEMLSFTVYHMFHHMNTIQRILG